MPDPMHILGTLELCIPFVVVQETHMCDEVEAVLRRMDLKQGISVFAPSRSTTSFSKQVVFSTSTSVLVMFVVEQDCFIQQRSSEMFTLGVHYRPLSIYKAKPIF